MDQQFLESIASKLNAATEEMVEKTVNEMLNSDEWVAKIERLATQRILDKVSSKINAIDVNLAIKDVVLENDSMARYEIKINEIGKKIKEKEEQRNYFLKKFGLK